MESVNVNLAERTYRFSIFARLGNLYYDWGLLQYRRRFHLNDELTHTQVNTEGDST
jgi:hypothetical protein